MNHVQIIDLTSHFIALFQACQQFLQEILCLCFLSFLNLSFRARGSPSLNNYSLKTLRRQLCLQLWVLARFLVGLHKKVVVIHKIRCCHLVLVVMLVMGFWYSVCIVVAFINASPISFFLSSRFFTFWEK